MKLSPNKQALLKIRELKQQLADAQKEPSERIAVVSMACRFPQQANSPEQFWQSLVEQKSQLGEIPADRWDLEAFYAENQDVPGKMYARQGAFLRRVDLLDAEFFGISPREATWVDPQQRLLLEAGWESLERAGWVADRIGPRTGVFVGWMHNDYQNEASDSFLNLNPYIATGAAGSFLCGRLAYYLGLEGPSVAIDTACSSSLVALHLACQSLTRHECDQALAGGVNVIASPTTNILTCKLKALSPTGQSRAFDAGANGYVRGEGCGVVTLKRFEDAERDGDPILAVIEGSAIGHNGTGSGLTVPNPKAQERVIREALRRAKIAPEEVAYLEAHGTGTELGDPIEMQAAVAALGGSRSDKNRLLVGSVKTNIGHLEAAAGMAGLIKVLLAMQHRVIAPQLNYETPNPHIPWANIPVDIVTKATQWPSQQRLVAGVSAFGMSGTNAHLVITNHEQDRAPSTPLNEQIAHRNGDLHDRISATSAAERIHRNGTNGNGTNGNGHATQRSATISGSARSTGPELLVISAKTDVALLEQAQQYRAWIAAHRDVPLADIARSAGVGRRHMEHRLALVADSHAGAEQILGQLDRGDNFTGLHLGQAQATNVAWQFTGQGCQYVGMAKELYRSEPVFQTALDDCESLIQTWRDESLLNVMWQHEETLNRTEWTQPALFAIQRGLAELLLSWGFQPDCLVGHSVGQYAAACIAGVMSWEQGLRLIAERGRLIGSLPDGGAMAAVFAPFEAVESAVDDVEGVGLAAQNGMHTVVSGEVAAVEKILERFQADGVRCKLLNTSHAFHSDLMNPILEPFQQFADQFTFEPPKIPLLCNVTGQLVGHEQILDGSYWADHIRQPVRYADGIAELQEMRTNFLLELGPQPVLSGMARSQWTGEKQSLACCLQRSEPDAKAIRDAIAQLFVSGVSGDLAAICSKGTGRHLQLPTYPFQRQRYWGPAKPKAAQAVSHTAHPLLGEKCALAGMAGEVRYEQIIEPSSPAWLSDHRVMEDVVFPGAAFVELALAIEDNCELADVVFEQPLRPAGRTRVQSVLKQEETGKSLQVFSTPEESESWSRCLRATVNTAVAQSAGTRDLDEVRQELTERAEPEHFYRLMADLGLNYGPEFQVIRSLQYSAQTVVADLHTTGDLRGYTIPPTLLDGAFHSLAAGLLRDNAEDLFLPVGIKRVVCHRAIGDQAISVAEWIEATGDLREAQITLVDQQGQVLVEIQGLQVKRLDRAVLRRMSGGGESELMYGLKWQNFRLPASQLESKSWLVVAADADEVADDSGSPSGLADLLRDQIVQRGHQVVLVRINQFGEPTPNDESGVQFDGTDPQQWSQLLRQFGGGDNPDAPAGVVWITAEENSSSGQFDLTAAKTQFPALMAFLAACAAEQIHEFACGFQIVTRNGLDVTGGDADRGSTVGASTQVDPLQTQFWGFGRALAAEHPELRCRLIDIDGGVSAPVGEDAGSSGEAASVTMLTESLTEYVLNDTTENQLAIRQNRYFVPRLLPTRIAELGEREFPIDPAGSYLVTGGLGMLGRQVGLWLAQQGARHVVLVSRREPSESTRAMIEQIEQLGCEVAVHQADSSLRSDVEQMCQRFGTDWPVLKGVIHAAGLVDDGLIADQNWERYQRVLEPKVLGASLLDELTRPFELNFFVLYSSAASLLGSPGQTNYASANGFLDGLAERRRQQGLPAVSLNWGPWTEGMADNELIIKRLALQGITPLSVDDAHDVLSKAVRADLKQVLVLDVDWKRMNGGGDGPPLFEKLTAAKRRTAAGDSELVGRLKTLQGTARQELLVETVQGCFQEILSTSEAPQIDRPLIEMGMDSLMAVEFSVQLQTMLGDDYTIAPTMLFDHPTIVAIADHVLEMLDSQAGNAVADGAASESVAVVDEGDTDEPSRQTMRDDVAIVGMACRFPGAENVDEFWANLLAGVDSVGEIPADRWDVDAFYSDESKPGMMTTKQGGFLDHIENFDAEFFGIADDEARWLDPQHRLLLENCWRALEDAGVRPFPLADPNVGVFMGIMSSDYASLSTLENRDIIGGFQGAGFSHSAGVGRISYTFGFEGPSLAIDTASSSSLVAVCQAMRALQDGQCNLALAGGVNAILTPLNSLLMSQTGMLSSDGRCKSFSAAADGFGRGEGCGVVALKRLADAERDGDQILAVVRGGAISHNGFSSGITAPNSRAQARMIQDALADAKLQPSQIQYLEAHGTGTEYGDPMELTAAAGVLGRGRKAQNRLLVGSVKANISHLEAAGGISGLIKTVLAIRHGVIPPQLHRENPSPHIPWKRMPLDLVDGATQWPEGDDRYAGVTALGLAGTNAHVVLCSQAKHRRDESEPVFVDDERHTDVIESSQDDHREELLYLSAKSVNSLRQMVSDYLECLSNNSGVRLGDLCYTAAVGRREFDQRICLLGATREQIIDQLTIVHGKLKTAADEQRTLGIEQARAYGGTVSQAPKVAWLFRESGLENLLTSRALFGHERSFRQVVERLDKVSDDAERSAGKLCDWFHSTDEQMPNEFSVDELEYVTLLGLAAIWQQYKVEPEQVAGFGVGQYAAAVYAGMLSEEEGFRLVRERERLPGRGSGVASEDADRETALQRFEEFADQMNYFPANRVLVDSLTGQQVPIQRLLGGTYWREHANSDERRPETLDTLTQNSSDLLLEIGVGPAEFGAAEVRRTLPSVEPLGDKAAAIEPTVAKLIVAGCPLDLTSRYVHTDARKISLPTYPFDRKRYWITDLDKAETVKT